MIPHANKVAGSERGRRVRPLARRRGAASASASATRGFTLVELLVVLVIIGVFAGMAAVSLRGRREDAAVRAAAKDVAAAVSYASTEARLRGRPYRVAFDAAGRSFQVEVWDVHTGEFRPAPGLPGRATPLPERVRVAGATPSIGSADLPPRDATADGEAPPVSVEFGPDGNFAGTLELAGPSGEASRVRVAALTCQVSVEH